MSGKGKSTTPDRNLAPPTAPPIVVRARRRRPAAWLIGTASVAVIALAAGLLVSQPWIPSSVSRPTAHAVSTPRSVEWKIAVTGTGPDLAWVADRQTAWARHAVTGTGPDLVFLARLQVPQPIAVTGTGDDLQRVAHQRDGVAIIGAP